MLYSCCTKTVCCMNNACNFGLYLKKYKRNLILCTKYKYHPEQVEGIQQSEVEDHEEFRWDGHDNQYARNRASSVR